MTVLSIARAALDTGPVCDNCLGRLFADRSFGLGNGERGFGLRVGRALEDDADFDPPAEDCWVCESECDRFAWWARQAISQSRGFEFATYQVGCKVPPLLAENDDLLREDIGLDTEAGEPFKREFNREVGKRIGEETGTMVDFDRPDVLFVCDLASDTVEMNVNSACIYGRYRKLERDIPQTEWPCRECHETGIKRGEECEGCDGTGYRYDRSVEELTCPVILEAMDGTEAVFHGAGREDVDALMTGTGRPFVIEVKTPRRRSVDVEELEADINEYADDAVEVTDLRRATHEMIERVKEHDASKTYRATVSFEDTIEPAELTAAVRELDGTTIEQETPHRVSHRRAAKVRTREVYEISGELEDESTARIDIHGEGGLYVKELISGDKGRTQPSLAGLLGVGASVTALDVLRVEGEDEPFEQAEFFHE